MLNLVRRPTESERDYYVRLLVTLALAAIWWSARP